ncbi:hypothetical protein QYM36_005136, partial [Artemia franciscana]
KKSERERMEAKVNDNSVVLRNGKKCDMDGRMKRLSKRLSTFICDIKDDVFGNSRSEECKAESEPEDVRDVIRLCTGAPQGIFKAASVHSEFNSEPRVSILEVNSSSHDRSQAPEDVEEDQWTLWGHLVRDWEENLKKRQCYLKDMARKGIPHHFRGAVWPLLCRSHDSPAKKRYSELIRATSACEKMPEEEAFAVLVKLMQEYRLREMFKPSMAELGLCVFQLKHLVEKPTKNPTGWLHARKVHRGANIHNAAADRKDSRISAKSIYCLCGFQGCFRFCRPAITLAHIENSGTTSEEFLPDLYVHFESQGFDTPMYASSWFLTLFTTNLTLPAACR